MRNPKKTIQQLKKSAVTSILIALMVTFFPLSLYTHFMKYGFIYTGKDRVVTASGDVALFIIYGIAGAVAYMWVMAVYNVVRTVMKIKRGEYSEKDETPEFVICSNCGEPQLSKELMVGHCHKCTGSVESLEGYYDRHPELKPESQTTPLQETSPATTFITCTKCGKTFYSEDCLGAFCQDCRTT